MNRILRSIFRLLVPFRVQDWVRARRAALSSNTTIDPLEALPAPDTPPLPAQERRQVHRSWRLRRRAMFARHYLRNSLNYYVTVRTQDAHRRAARAAHHYTRSPLLPDHVMYETYNCRDFAGNPYALFRYLLDHPDYKHLTHVIAIADASNPKVARFADHPRVKVVVEHTEAFIRYAETCKYYVNNASFKPYVIKRPGQVYVTSWHSTLLKKLAKDTGRPWEAMNVSRALLASDIHLSPNELTTEHLLRSHSVDGIMPGRILEMGYPRNDLTVNVDWDAVRRALGVNGDDKVAVYAPTWRGSYAPENTARLTIAYAEQIRAALPDGWTLFVKLHSLVQQFVDDDIRPHLAPEGLDTNELLGATDLLITDYSGIFFDYLLTGNPVLYYTPDREAYAASKNGFYIPLESLPGPLCDNMDALAQAINDLDAVKEKYADTYRDFVQRFVPRDDGKVCDRVARLLFAGETFEEFESKAPAAQPSGKTRILTYPANLAGNGVTESFLALLDRIDYERFDVIVLLPSPSKYRNAQQRVNRHAKIFYQNAQDGFLRHEYVQERAMSRWGITTPADVPVAAFQRTFRRIFGDLDFDVVVNYNGYFPNAAARIASAPVAGPRLIWMHNDLGRDRVIKHPQLNAVFTLYQMYDRLVCVSADSLQANVQTVARYAERTFGLDLEPKMHYSRNVIVPSEIERRAGMGRVTNIDGHGYLLMEGVEEGTVTGVRFEPAHTNFVCVGRLSPEKNHARLLDAFSKVASGRDDVHLFIVGTGALSNELHGMVRNLGLSTKVSFTGFMSNPLPLVAHANAFVLASDIEGQPITVLEALVLGCPVIASDIPGPRDLLKDGGGVLVDQTPEAVARAMQAVISGQPICDGVASFAAEVYVDEALDEFYRHVASGGQP
jgi:CDP-glycerol glycerophosphotransferase